MTLNIRSTDVKNEIVVESVRYLDTRGNKLKWLLQRPLKLSPLATTDFVIARDRESGAGGASFLVEWAAGTEVSPPVVESMRIDSSTTRGLAIIAPGIVIEESKPLDSVLDTKKRPLVAEVTRDVKGSVCRLELTLSLSCDGLLGSDIQKDEIMYGMAIASWIWQENTDIPDSLICRFQSCRSSIQQMTITTMSSARSRLIVNHQPLELVRREKLSRKLYSATSPQTDSYFLGNRQRVWEDISQKNSRLFPRLSLSQL